MSGSIALMLAACVSKLTLSGASISDTFAAACTVGLTVKADGTVWKADTSVGNTQLSSSTDWIVPKAGQSAYTVRAHATSGTVSTGTMDTDTSLATDQSWTVAKIASGSKSCTLTVTVKFGGTTIVSNTYTLTATVP